MGTKRNPGEFDCYEHAEDDEPMFILLARDESASFLVDAWADKREQNIRLGLHPEEDRAKVREARECAAAMRLWWIERKGGAR